MRRGLIALAGLLATGAAAPPALTLGVNVHFGQGWPATAVGLLADTGAPVVREAISWRRIETVPGRHDFSDATVGYLDRLCAGGVRVVLDTPLAHPAYDGGQTVHSDGGRAALARFLGAVAARYRDCLLAIEIGNEINIPANVTGPAAATRAASHVAILRAVYPAIKTAAPALAVLGGSANSIATGFEVALAEAGMLAVVDGVAIHPYRADAANLDWELAHLAAELAARGPARPLWLTEFSKDFRPGEDAAAFLLKLVTQMSAAGIAQADWYALIDQPAFPTMGLFTSRGQRKPAGDAFRHVVADLLPRGRAERIGDDPTLFHYRFGTDRQILWGAPRPIRYDGAATARDSRGQPVPLPDAVSPLPVIIEGAARLGFGPAAIVADSLAGYGRAPWSYAVRRAGGPERPLALVDWNWTSHFGEPGRSGAAINQTGLVAGGAAALISHWTAPEAGALFALACLVGRDGARARLEIRRNGTAIASPAAPVASDTAPTRLVAPVQVAAGDRIAFIVLPLVAGGRGNFGYRFQLARTPIAAPDCRPGQ